MENDQQRESEAASGVRSVKWSEILERFRADVAVAQRQSKSSAADAPSSPLPLQEKYREYFPSVFRQLSAYDDRLSGESRLRPDESKEERKSLVAETRNALRFAVSCISSGSANTTVSEEEVIHQDEAALLQQQQQQQNATLEYDLDRPIARILCRKNGDGKCRLLAARLLCNLVTSNPKSAARVVSRLPLTPSEASIARRIANSSSVLQQQQDGDEATVVAEPTWLDMMLCCCAANGDNRDALAAIVAAMHNAIVCLDDDDEEDNDRPRQDRSADNSNDDEAAPSSSSFAVQVSSNSLLVSTLLRQTLSVKSVKTGILDDGRAGADRTPATAAAADDLSDEATEWIALTVGRLSRMGHLPTMYGAIAGSGGTDSSSSTSATVVLPEQLVLLHCVHKAISEEGDNRHQSGNGNGRNADRIAALAFFLVELYAKLRRRRHSPSTQEEEKPSSPREDANDRALLDNATLTVLEILAGLFGSSSLSSSLPSAAIAPLEVPDSCGGDSAAMAALLRVRIGQETNFVETVGRHAGELLDGIMEVYQNGKIVPGKQKDRANYEDQGPVLIVLIRLLGYLCYHCRSNQDLVRTVEVPVLQAPPPGAQAAAPPPASNRADAAAAGEAEDVPVRRTVLHVLLSCTSLSFVCFPLREWSVVALRLALQDNLESQAAVEALQAQRGVQTAALDEMGMNVQLDRHGKVKLVPK